MKHTLLKADDFSRRQFINQAAKAFLGVTTLPLVANQANAAGRLGSDTVPVNRPIARNIIYLYMSGGMTHMDTFDPKPGHENGGPVKAIKTKADGVQISEYLPLLSTQMDKGCIIRGLSSTKGAHEQGNYFMHTSYAKRATIVHPCMGAWATRFQDRSNTTLPGSVIIGGGSRFAGSGFLGSKHSPLGIGSPTAGLQNSKIMRGVTEEQFDSRLALAGKLGNKFRNKYNLNANKAYSDMYADAIKLMSSKDLEAFDINKESESMKDLYGKEAFGQGCLLARRLVENNVRYVEVNYGGWDTHQNNFVSVPEKAAILDQGLTALITDLESRGLLDETLIVLATEFGRTPRINQNAGRDHYPKAFSGFMAGGGIKGGQVWGKTDEGGENVIENKVAIPDYNATIAYALGLPLGEVVYSPSRRPFTVADKGEPLTHLFG
jgi:hypothetical protein